jgi:hypothetical protein
MDIDMVKKLIEAVFAAPPALQEKALGVLRGESTSLPVPAISEPYVTLKVCAKALGVSATSLWRYQIPGNELGGRRKFRVSEVAAYLESEEFRVVSKLIRKERTRKVR